MERLRQLARKDDATCYLGQYENPDVRNAELTLNLPLLMCF